MKTNQTLTNATQKVDNLFFFIISNSLPNEIWKEIKDTDSNYFISSKGRVLSICRSQPIILKQFICGNGYYYVDLKGCKRVNRLVAEAFIDNPEDKTIVHHKDNNKLNNDISNLEWVSPSENIRYYLESIK